MKEFSCKLATPTLVELLRSTLRRLEQVEGLSPSDPALQEVKRMILRSIAEIDPCREGWAA